MKNELENNQFDDLELFFRKKLIDNEIAPSKNVWTKIETELDKEKTRPKFFWWFSLCGLLLALLLGAYLFYPPIINTAQYPGVSDVTISQTQKDTDIGNISMNAAQPGNMKQKSGNGTTFSTAEALKPVRRVTLVQIGSFRYKPSDSYFKKYPIKLFPEKETTV